MAQDTDKEDMVEMEAHELTEELIPQTRAKCNRVKPKWLNDVI